jgi:hypothetical protein
VASPHFNFSIPEPSDSLLLCSDDPEAAALARGNAAENVKRVVVRPDAPLKENPYLVLDFQEIKTTWHPVGC